MRYIAFLLSSYNVVSLKDCVGSSYSSSVPFVPSSSELCFRALSESVSSDVFFMNLSGLTVVRGAFCDEQSISS